jgi:DNA topoisomerase-2
MKISDFFKNDYVDQASYDNLRKIASVIDGQKNSSRKILYTILEKNIKSEIKVSQLGSKVSEFAEYLHGSLDDVIVNLAQNFTGTNNIPLLVREGNFGTRFAQEASAPRYIYTNGSAEFFELFDKIDNDILKKQYFEGHQIEPMFYVPNLPILLINGSEGVSSGFAQKILPRNPKKIKKYLTDYLTNSLKPNKSNSLEPYYEGFTGDIKSGAKAGQWLISGIVKKTGVNKVEITEVPVGYELRSYIKVLDDLEEKKVITSYRDKSENDKFLFEVSIPSRDLKTMSDEQLLTKLKLVKTVTENYTVINENNKIIVYDSVKDLLTHYIRIKLEYLQKRKEESCLKLEEEIRFDYSKYLFIKMIVDEELIINKRKKADIEKDLEKVEKIVSKDGYDYLLNMNILSLTSERMKKLQESIKQNKSNLDELIKTSIEDIWLKSI